MELGASEIPLVKTMNYMNCQKQCVICVIWNAWTLTGVIVFIDYLKD